MSEAPKNKQSIMIETIRAGGATRESLMEAAKVDKAGFASQIAGLNSRGLAMAEVDQARAEFPVKGEDGVYRFGTFEEFNANRKAFGTTAKPKTKEEVLEGAQKREDKASAAYSKAADKAKDNPSDEIFAKIVEVRKAELDLASMKLSKVQEGDYTYENVTITDTPAPKKGRKGEQAETQPMI